MHSLQHCSHNRKMKSFYLLALSVALFSAAIGTAKGDDDCVYTLFVKTGIIVKAGTDSKISVTLGDKNGNFVFVKDLESWGLMEANHDYFEMGNLDAFSGRGPCLEPPVCRLHVASDGSGLHHGWYLEYVEITTTGPHKQCTQTGFQVDQWLAVDRSPYQLTADIDGCSDFNDRSVKQGAKRKFIFGKPSGSAAAA